MVGSAAEHRINDRRDRRVVEWQRDELGLLAVVDEILGRRPFESVSRGRVGCEGGRFGFGASKNRICGAPSALCAPNVVGDSRRRC